MPVCRAFPRTWVVRLAFAALAGRGLAPLRPTEDGSSDGNVPIWHLAGDIPAHFTQSSFDPNRPKKDVVIPPFALFSGSEPSGQTRSSAGFITTMCGFEFSVHTMMAIGCRYTCATAGCG